jgi:hypothetical protein
MLQLNTVSQVILEAKYDDISFMDITILSLFNTA